jgi:hypothetical protein
MDLAASPSVMKSEFCMKLNIDGVAGVSLCLRADRTVCEREREVE